MSDVEPKHKHRVRVQSAPRKFIGVLGAITLLADIAGLAQAAYTVFVLQDLTNVMARMVIILLVFVAGIALGRIGLSDQDEGVADKIISFYLWAYLALACVTYLGVIKAFQAQDYTVDVYFQYIFIVGVQLGVFYILQRICRPSSGLSYPILLLTMTVLHLLIFVRQYFFVEMPAGEYIVSEILFWSGWAIFAGYMLYKADQHGSRMHLAVASSGDPKSTGQPKDK